MFALLWTLAVTVWTVLHGSWRCAPCPEAWWRRAGLRSGWWWRYRSEAGQPRGPSHCSAASGSYPGPSGSEARTDRAREGKAMTENFIYSYWQLMMIYSIWKDSAGKTRIKKHILCTSTCTFFFPLNLLHLLLSVYFGRYFSPVSLFKGKNLIIYKWS